jgi:hypothetical protein
MFSDSGAGTSGNGGSGDPGSQEDLLDGILFLRENIIKRND